MVQKRRLVILFLIFILLGFIATVKSGKIETNMLKTLLPKNIVDSTYIVPLADRTASNIKIVFEGVAVNEENSTKDLNTIKEQFLQKIDKDYFEIVEYNTKELVNEYLKSPTNFVSPRFRSMLRNKKYDEIFNERFSALLDPAGIQLSALDKDPYLFLDDFLLSNRHKALGVNEFDNRVYDYATLKIKNKEGLSPNLTNKKIKELVNIQHDLSNEKNKIYLAGNPIHSYYTSTKSFISINIICILSILLVAFLTWFYFKTTKLLFPISLAIIGGMLAGYVSTKFLFYDFQIITMVFSTTLIGVGIDYSYHYFFAKNIDKTFYKNLTYSLLSTVIPFGLLYITGIELLKQISVYTTIGLIMIYFIVVFIYPAFPKYEPKTITNTPDIKSVKIFLLTTFIISLLGFIRFEFNDSLTALYTPSTKLMNAENLYYKVAGNDYKDTQFIVISGKNLNNIIEKEEIITSKLDTDKIEYTSLSSFIPSAAKQKENFELVKDLYKNNLNKFAGILTPYQISNLKGQNFIPVEINSLFTKVYSDFLIDENTSVIVVFSNHKLDFDNVVNIQSDIKNYMIKYRTILLVLFAPIFFILAFILSISYGIKNGLKMLTPPIFGIISAIGLTLLILGELNVFSILATYMVLGFTIDYSVFRTTGEKRTEDAILVSCITTTFAFLLLSVCGFKMLSSISLILFFGILIAYLCGYVLFKNKE